MTRDTVSLYVTMCGKQKKERGTQTQRVKGHLQYDKWVERKGSFVAACVVDSDGRSEETRYAECETGNHWSTADY